MRRTAERQETSADAIFYQVYVRSFADANGDGIGDLEGIRSRLGYLELLDVDGLWLIPHHPLTEDLDAFDRLLAEAHDRAFKVVIELPPEASGTDAVRFWLDRGVDGFRTAAESHGVLAVDRNPALLDAEFDADAVRKAIEHAGSAWALSTHDATRHVTRYGGGELGHRRARAMALVLLALPGIVAMYNGEELGLPDVELPEWASGDRSRVPLPWEGSEPPFGFSPGGQSWLPIPREWAGLTVEAQLEDPESMLCLYRLAVELRKTHSAVRGGTIEWYGAPTGCFAFRRTEGRLVCALNTGSAPVPLPPGELLISSGSLVDGQLPPDTAAWLV
jgi:glycosidase